MKKFVVDELGGVSIESSYGDIYVRLSADEVKELFDVLQRQKDLQFVRSRVPDWVEKQLEDDDVFFADFNSHLFSGDEISQEEIVQKILSDEGLIRKIADEYRDILDDPATEDAAEWWLAEEAIGNCLTINDVMGEILREKHPTELEIGRWRVLLIEQGDLYGSEGNRVPWLDTEPCVEFYDMYVDKTRHPHGKFTTGRFYVDQLVHPGFFTPSLEDLVEDGAALLLNPVKEDWKVGAGDLNVISAWLKACYEHAKPSIEMRLAEAKAERETGEKLPWNFIEKDLGI